MDPRVLDVMMPYLTTAYGNPSSLHYFGQQARAAVQTARSQVAHCLGVKGEDLVFTVGVIKTGATAAISVIPGEVSFTVDMRSLSADTCERFHALMLEEAAKLEAERGVRFEFDKPLYTAPGHVDPALSEKLAHAAEANGIPCMRLPSGAGHDAAVIGGCGIPVAMIFIANQNGSHNPYEEMQMKDFMIGTDLLWHTVKAYD